MLVFKNIFYSKVFVLNFFLYVFVLIGMNELAYADEPKPVSILSIDKVGEYTGNCIKFSIGIQKKTKYENVELEALLEFVKWCEKDEFREYHQWFCANEGAVSFYCCLNDGTENMRLYSTNKGE